jgi:uncharacterized protein YcbK (DUF882 family)
MLEDSNYFIWNKGDVYFLGKEQFFKTSEFACQCKNVSCREQRVHKDLIKKLIDLRKEINEPLIVTSGFRCGLHQEQLRKEGVNTVVAKKSSHEKGDAADIKPTRMNMLTFFKIVDKYFEAIGTAKTFLHVDLRTGKERRWDY